VGAKQPLFIERPGGSLISMILLWVPYSGYYGEIEGLISKKLSDSLDWSFKFFSEGSLELRKLLWACLNRLTSEVACDCILLFPNSLRPPPPPKIESEV
jgi:hypothetical protein